MDIIVFGTSKGKDEIESYLDLSKVNIIGYLDNDKCKQAIQINNKPVYSPKDVKKLKYDFIIIGSKSYQDNMHKQLIELGVLDRKIITPYNGGSYYFKKIMKEAFSQVDVQKEMFKKEFLTRPNHFLVAQNESMRNPVLDYYDYDDYSLKGIDFVRVSSVDLLAREIEANKVKGAIGELGVYQGNFTKYLSNLFPEKDMYLFDTFEGFNEKDIALEGEKSYSNAKVGRFSNTTEELVLNKILNPDRVTIIKGYFPESVPVALEAIYAFVSIDVDLYKPTYDGLKYFYNKLSKGGYILIHDYNFEYYSGVKVAVRKFCEENAITPLPIADYYGSVIICK